MPQKRNPDAAELVRAKVGRIAGAFHSLTLVMKGTASGLFQGHAGGQGGHIRRPRQLRCGIGSPLRNGRRHGAGSGGHDAAAAGRGFSTATDLADWLVRELRVPFREAHHITGRIVAQAEADRCDLGDLQLDQLQSVDERINESVFSVLSVEKSVASRTSFGGTAPQNVRKMAQSWIKRLENGDGPR